MTKHGDAGGSAPDEVLELLRLHGRCATSFQVLEPGLRYWIDDGACVAYAETGGVWVVAGEPLAAVEALSDVTDRFLRHAACHGRRVVFFAVEARFVEATGLPSLLIGFQPVWDPALWPETLRSKRSLREQLRRARAKGVTVRRMSSEALAPGAPARREIEGLVSRWLAARPMPPMGFLVQVHLFEHVDQRRIYVAERGGALVGLLGAVPVPARNGWFFEDLLRTPDAASGTNELLIDAAMRELADAGASMVTMGLAPLAGDVVPALKRVRRLGRPLYDFEGLWAFKGKLAPHGWEPVHLATSRSAGLPRALFDAVRTFAPEGVWRFATQTLLRGPAIVLRVLGALLLPWTVLLTLAPAEAWFPSAAVKWGWVAFDGLLLLCIYALLRRWRPLLATAVASAVTCDAALTWLQALTFNLPRARGVLEHAFIAVALAGPTLAAPLLWRARSRQRVFDRRGRRGRHGRGGQRRRSA